MAECNTINLKPTFNCFKNKDSMKALFESKFPFVTLPNEELTKEQLEIKRQYQDAYIPKEEKTDKLREVHVDDKRAGKRTK